MPPDDNARAAAAALALLPKVELHCHVEGTMRPGPSSSSPARNGLALPAADPASCTATTSLNEFLRVFWLVQATPGGARADWARLAYESVLDARPAGVVYRETFFTPARHLAAGQDLGDVVRGLGEGLAAAEGRPGAGHAHLRHRSRLRGPGRYGAGRALGTSCGGRPRCQRSGLGMDSTELGVTG